jgi:hypothetical protein
MARNILVLLSIAVVSLPAWPARSDEPSEMLTQAEALYYAADFAKSVELLRNADELLRQQPGRLAEKIAVKLQLALGFIGLNDGAQAKTHLGELYALDLDYQIDPRMFSPKVIRLADEARAEQGELRCRSLVDEAQRYLGAGNGDAVVKLIGSSQTRCSGLAALNPMAADVVFKEGLEAYRKDQVTEALQKFRAALGVDPKHDLASQYVELTEGRLEVTAERVLLAWRKDFNSGEFALAARNFRELKSLSSSAVIDEVHGEYRQALSRLADSWNQACASDDAALMEKLRNQVNEMLPEPSFGEDILAGMKTCTPAGCIQMGTQLALARLQTRVDPRVPSNVMTQMKAPQVKVHVKARINEDGFVASSELEGNPLLYDTIRAAMGQWRFRPALTNGEPRCVETEIPFIFNF